MVTLQELAHYTDTFLQTDSFRDYCPNGLQVEGKETIGSVITGVTASLAMIDVACARQADAVLVHHGYFWKNEDSCITGIKRARLAVLLRNDISLLAYHLPLDAHPEVGNNVQLGRLLGIQIDGLLQSRDRDVCGSYGHLDQAIQAETFERLISTKLRRSCIHVDAGPAMVKTVGWCTGAGQGFIELAVKKNLDAYISGEISEPTAHIAREAKIHYFAAGHHATERYGIQALGEHLRQEFSIRHEFVDIDNPA
ncbi:MAG: Nif3-like dinuclear metal center hexameric protein [Gammaproteobacteria bacterium]|nr:Nif3-like dinuclear metal center hexameric protein [Gammaproteobacteria bacterium]